MTLLQHTQSCMGLFPRKKHCRCCLDAQAGGVGYPTSLCFNTRTGQVDWHDGDLYVDLCCDCSRFVAPAEFLKAWRGLPLSDAARWNS